LKYRFKYFDKLYKRICIFTCLPATPMKIENSTAKGITITDTIKQKRSKAIDMQLYWLKVRHEQEQIDVFWEPGKNNLANYPTEYHQTQWQAGENKGRKIPSIKLITPFTE